MNLFISWSGELSRQIAEELRLWFPAVLQSIKPYFTPSDIEKGARWSSDIAEKLAESDFGIFCLTRENLQSPWILFEAGAISKQVGTANVCPILFEIENVDLSGPLTQFQSTKFEKGDFLKLLRNINEKAADQGLSDETLSSVFEMWWPRLEENIQRIITSESSVENKELRSDREILEETLEQIRHVSRKVSTPSMAIFSEGDGEKRYGIVTSLTPDGKPYATRATWTESELKGEPDSDES